MLYWLSAADPIVRAAVVVVFAMSAHRMKVFEPDVTAATFLLTVQEPMPLWKDSKTIGAAAMIIRAAPIAVWPVLSVTVTMTA